MRFYFFLAGGKTVLVPWDMQLAQDMANTDRCVAFEKFKRNPMLAALYFIYKQKPGSVIEISEHFPFPLVQDIIAQAPNYKILCHTRGLEHGIQSFRCIKDEQEIALMRKACQITNSVLNSVIHGLQNKQFSSEAEIAMFIEKTARHLGADSTSFETLAAMGAERSCMIHPYPTSTAGFSAKGLSILDFGVRYQGYCSDITMPIIPPKPNKAIQKMIKAIKLCQLRIEAMLRPGLQTADLAEALATVLSDNGYFCPHGFGHALGLEVHELPRILADKTKSMELQPGMILAIEPGIYDRKTGGIRLENDYLITDNGFEKLTESDLLFL